MTDTRASANDRRIWFAQIEFCDAVCQLNTVFRDGLTAGGGLCDATQTARFSNARQRMMAGWMALDSHSFRGASTWLRPWAGMGRSFYEALGWYLAVDKPSHGAAERAPLTQMICDLGELAAHFYALERERLQNLNMEGEA